VPDSILLAAPADRAPEILRLVVKRGLEAVLADYIGCGMLFPPLDAAMETLETILGCGRPDEDEPAPLADGGEDGPWVVEAPAFERIARALAGRDLDQLARTWARIRLESLPSFERPTWTRKEIVTDLREYLQDLMRVHEESIRRGTSLLIVTEL
jgi:hypothetical protein